MRALFLNLSTEKVKEDLCGRAACTAILGCYSYVMMSQAVFVCVCVCVCVCARARVYVCWDNRLVMMVFLRGCIFADCPFLYFQLVFVHIFSWLIVFLAGTFHSSFGRLPRLHLIPIF